MKPVDAATYKEFLTQYDYDRKPLNAKIVSSDSSDADWVREDIPSMRRLAARDCHGHFLPGPEMVTETLRWFDQYLGVVAKP